MIFNLLLLFTILFYSIVVSQSFMYILSLKHAQLNLEADAYISLRKLLDQAMTRNFKYVIYLALLFNLILVIATLRNPFGILFITSLISLLALIGDVLIAVKRSLPINATINTWKRDAYPTDWSQYRSNWLKVFRYRQVLNIIGFVSLLVGAVFK